MERLDGRGKFERGESGRVRHTLHANTALRECIYSIVCSMRCLMRRFGRESAKARHRAVAMYPPRKPPGTVYRPFPALSEAVTSRHCAVYERDQRLHCTVASFMTRPRARFTVQTHPGDTHRPRSTFSQ